MIENSGGREIKKYRFDNSAGENDIVIKMDEEKSYDDAEESHDVYIGGPSSAVGAALQVSSGQSVHKVLYGHDGKRGTYLNQ